MAPLALTPASGPATTAAALRRPSATAGRARRCARQGPLRTVAAAEGVPRASRRDVMLGGATAAGMPLLWPGQASAENSFKKQLPLEQLSGLQKDAMREQMLNRCKDALRDVLTAEDAAGCMRLVLLDAGTYDVQSKTGGMNGSVILGGELSGEDKSALAPLVKKLEEAKKVIDEKTAAAGQGQGNITWADLLVVAGKVAIYRGWVQDKINRAETPEGGRVIAEGFGAPFEVKIGRVDSAEKDSGLAIPGKDASIEEIKAWLGKLGNKAPDAKPGPFTPKPPFWERPGYLVWTAGQLDPKAAEEKLAVDPIFGEFKEKYDKSKRTVTRTDFEVDFVTYYNRLASYAKFDPFAYCYPIEIKVKNL